MGIDLVFLYEHFGLVMSEATIDSSLFIASGLSIQNAIIIYVSSSLNSVRIENLFEYICLRRIRDVFIEYYENRRSEVAFSKLYSSSL